MDSTTNPFKNGSFNLDGELPIRVSDSVVPVEVEPFLNNTQWEQYSDDLVYQCDKAFREWLAIMSTNSKWKRSRTERIYMFSHLFERVFGRKYNQKEDSKVTVKLARIFAYYSTTRGKHYYDSSTGKTKNKTSYCISSKALDKPAYSLRLRFEEMSAKGILPNNTNMRLPKDDLKPGHSRNPKTEANKQRMSEEGRRRYNEYQHMRKQYLASRGEA